ncbi:MAG: hypothetical protein AAF298_21000 [Cyanobacteria bacterium P01_A01_bin.40]
MEENRLPESGKRDVDIGTGNYNENIEGDYEDRKTVINAEIVNINNPSSSASSITNESKITDSSIFNDYITEPSEKLKAFPWKKRPLLAYLMDRESQDRKLNQLFNDFISNSNSNKPIICILHGDKSQGHDKFLERTREVFLRTKIKLDHDCSINRYLIRCPKNINNQQEFHEQLCSELATEITKDSLSSVQEINETISDVHTMIYIHLSVEDWYQLKIDCIGFFLEFWQKWTDLCSGQFLMVCLSIKYPTEENLSFCKRYRLRRMKRKFINRLEQYFNSQLSQSDRIMGTILPELKGIKQIDVEDWLSIEVEKLFQDDGIIEHLNHEITFLYENWEKEHSSKVIPMNDLAENLGKLLKGKSLR